jgi:hypothetical protein
MTRRRQQEEIWVINRFERIAGMFSADADYCFDKPKMYLTARELARLTILRSRLGETRAERESEMLVGMRDTSSGSISS